MGRKLYVGNLSYGVGEAELHALFERIGAVDTVQIVRDQMTGQARGFAFVEMQSQEDAQRAATELNDVQHEGRRLVVNEARPRAVSPGGDRSPHGGGRGRGGSASRW